MGPSRAESGQLGGGESEGAERVEGGDEEGSRLGRVEGGFEWAFDEVEVDSSKEGMNESPF